MEFWKLFNAVKPALPQGQNIYLVGGSVRDLLLNRPVHDLDFVMEGNTREAARRTAANLGMSFFVLDDARDMARVIYAPFGDSRKVTLDFTYLLNNSLEADLRNRDFTINAIAMRVDQPDELLDPTGGADDLRAKRLRACAPEALRNDPLRVLRAFRISNQLRLRIDKATLNLIREAAPLLPNVSAERQRDEIFKILSGVRPAAAFQAMQPMGVLPYVLPELEALVGVRQSPPHVAPVWEHTLDVVRKLDLLLSLLGKPHDPDKVGDLTTSLAVLHLGRFRRQIESHLKAGLNPERPHAALLLMAALYHDAAKPATATVDEVGKIHNFGHEEQGARMCEMRARALMLSNEEVERLRIIVRHHMRVHLLAQAEGQPTRRAIYRFFKDTREAGVDICLLSLADMMATYAHTLPVETWTKELEVCRALLEAWWEKPEEVVRPPILVDGNDLMDELALEPGPLIGRLLEAVREAQAGGQVHTRAEALDFARKSM